MKQTIHTATKTIAAICMMTFASACSQIKNPLLPQPFTVTPTPVAPAPKMSPTPTGGIGTPLFSTSFSSSADIGSAGGWQDNPGVQSGGASNNPYLNAGYSTPSGAFMPSYSSTTQRNYYHAFSPWYGDLEMTFWVYSCPTQATVGYDKLDSGHLVSGFRWLKGGTQDGVEVWAGSTWSIIKTWASSSNTTTWHQYKLHYHSSTHLSDYWVDGVKVASGMNSYNPGIPAVDSDIHVYTTQGYPGIGIDDIEVTGY